MSGFEHTARRPPGETPTGPVRIPTPPGMPPGSAPSAAPPSNAPPNAAPAGTATSAGTETARQRRRVRASGSRTIAVVGVAGGVGATTVSAGLLSVLPERVGGAVGLGDHVGGVLGARAAEAGTAAPSGPLVSDLGPHACGDAEVLARIGDVVVVVVAPLDPEGVRRGEAARRAIVERRDGDAGAAVLVVAESRPTRTGPRRRALIAARESARTIVIRWDPSLADRRPLDFAAFSDATRSSFSELCDAIRS